MASGLPIDTAGFRDALVILGAAGLVIPAFHRLRVTPLIGFILVGVLVGPSVLGALGEQVPWIRYFSIEEPEAIEPFAEIGIILLLFSIGLELSFKRLWGMRRLVFLLGAGELLVAAALIAGVLTLAGQPLATAAALGLALSLSSTALVLTLVGTRGPVGRPAFAMLLFEDVALVPIIFALGVLSPIAADAGAGAGALARTVLAGGAAVALILVGGRFLVPKLFAQAARTKSPELLISAILLVVIGCSLITTLAGLSPIVGALVAGLVIAETSYRAQVEVMVEPFKNLALGIFLITVGMSLDLEVIAANWAAILAAVVLVVAVKSLVTATLLKLGGAPVGVAVNTGVLMAAPSETTLIVLTAAVGARVISPEEGAFWQIVTAIGLTITPFLARVGARAGAEAQRLRPETSPPALREEAEPPARVIVLGFGRVGRVIASMLDRHNIPYVAVDGDADVVSAARRQGKPLIFGDGSRLEFLKHLDAGAARALVVTLDGPRVAEHVVAAARAEWPQLIIIARARDARHAAALYRAGASDAVPETVESSLQLSEAVLVDVGLAVGPVIASIHERRAELRGEIQAMVPGLEEEPALGRRSRRRARDGVAAPEV